MSKQTKLMLEQMGEIVSKYNGKEVVVEEQIDNTEIKTKVKEFTIQFNTNETDVDKIVKILTPKGNKSSFVSIDDEEDFTIFKLFYNKTGLNVPTANFDENKFVLKDIKDAIRDKKKEISTNPLKAIRDKMISEKKEVNDKTLLAEAKLNKELKDIITEEDVKKYLVKVAVGNKLGATSKNK